jgi:plastocyanin
MRWIAGLGLVALVGLLSPEVVHAADGPASATVSMKDFTFIPASVTVRSGGTVTWTYDESATDPMPNCESLFFQTPLPVNCPGHSTTAVDKGPDGKVLWDSGVHRADGFPFKFTFSKPGTYHYICVVHGGANANNPVTHMEGDIVVTAVAATAVTAGANVQGANNQRAALAVTGLSSVWPRLGALVALAALAVLAIRRRLATVGT